MIAVKKGNTRDARRSERHDSAYGADEKQPRGRRPALSQLYAPLYERCTLSSLSVCGTLCKSVAFLNQSCFFTRSASNRHTRISTRIRLNRPPTSNG